MSILKQNLKIFVFFTLLTGFIYPLMVTLVAEGLFKEKAHGSLLVKIGKVVGSNLIAQDFKGKKYFWPRPSATNYDASSSAASNLSPNSKVLHETVEKRALELGLNKESKDDLLYASGSGLDPHISPESALRQVTRIADARHLDRQKVELLKNLITSEIEGKHFGFMGRERVNVLKLNLLLDEKF